ncbi:MAG TPA: hypothetical protein VLA56_10560 [Pseudomonadales bacterium]|nr:hypothetical protein [Pseudomonadales bacterium]
MQNDFVPRSLRTQLVLSVLLVGAIGLQALAACAVCLTSSPSFCCPSHEADGTASVAAACCAAVDQSGQTAIASAGTVKPSLVRSIEPVWARPPHLRTAAGSCVLPVAARGHATVSLSAFLI